MPVRASDIRASDIRAAKRYAAAVNMSRKLRNIEVRVFTSHEDVERADLREQANMSKEERLLLGRELHAFWVRNCFPNATRLARAVQVVERQGG